MTTPPRTNWSGQPWLTIQSGDLLIERQQAQDEGRDVASLQTEFDKLLAVDLAVDPQQQRAEILLDRIQAMPLVAGYGYIEPSDLPTIRAERPAGVSLPPRDLGPDQLLDKAHGGWLARCCGCLLGKPAEGRRRAQIETYLKAQNRWPLARYFSLQSARDLAVQCGFNLDALPLYEEGITAMPEDDDTNYTVAGLAVVERHGAAFAPEDVARFWLQELPILHVCTAERVAYRNLVNGVPPPASARFRNVYREWIGAQIRADAYGYVNPGNPVRAAEFAWRDASISHVKNGIYGAMWVAAMLASAYISDDVETVIRAGLQQIPDTSRLSAAVQHILERRHRGATFDDAIADVHAQWKEADPHHWCHAISNAEIVAAALLWGGQELEATLCNAVTPGFDTDCNAATAGSVLGVMLGARALPGKWTDPLRDTLHTGIHGVESVSIAAMAERTLKQIHALASAAA